MKNKIISYTLGEELFSSISHGVGALFGVAALVLMVIKSAIAGSALKVVCSAVFGASIIILYSMSTLYHAITNKTAKAVFRILDHTTIFILIAGTYTPICLITLGGALGWTIFGIQWGVAALGITLNAISIERFKVFSMIGYVALGWCVVFAARPMIESMAPAGLWLMLLGGLFYTGGIIFYALKKIKYMHSVWHLFVLAGTVTQTFSIANYIL